MLFAATFLKISIGTQGYKPRLVGYVRCYVRDQKSQNREVPLMKLTATEKKGVERDKKRYIGKGLLLKKKRFNSIEKEGGSCGRDRDGEETGMDEERGRREEGCKRKRMSKSRKSTIVTE